MRLRAYGSGDLDAVAALFTASVHRLAADHYDEAQRSAWAPRPPDVEGWRLRLSGLRVVVAEDGDQLCGFCGWEDDGHIDLLFVAPERAGRGVAQALFDHAAASLAAQGITELFTDASLVARPFFERQGFRVEEEQRVERGGIELRRFAMRLQRATNRRRAGASGPVPGAGAGAGPATRDSG